MIFRLLRSIICAELCSRPVRRSLGVGGSASALVAVVAGIGPIQTRRRSATEVVCSRPVRRSLGEGGSAFALVEVVAGCRAYPNAKAFGYEVVCSRPVRRSLGEGGSASALVEVVAGCRAYPNAKAWSGSDKASPVLSLRSERLQVSKVLGMKKLIGRTTRSLGQIRQGQ